MWKTLEDRQVSTHTCRSQAQQDCPSIYLYHYPSNHSVSCSFITLDEHTFLAFIPNASSSNQSENQCLSLQASAVFMVHVLDVNCIAWIILSSRVDICESINNFKRVAELISAHSARELLGNLVLALKTTLSTNKTVNPLQLQVLFWMLINNILERQTQTDGIIGLWKGWWRHFKTQTPGWKMTCWRGWIRCGLFFFFYPNIWGWRLHWLIE